MGEAWRAFDGKLRVDVALKALHLPLSRDTRRRGLLRAEVRAAREVVSPNVCRIFDLIEVDGRELVSMEYVGGATMLAVLRERGPLELKEAQDIASEFLAGLEAILLREAKERLRSHPTGELAYAIASLEQVDNPEVRRLALDALWQGPTEIRLEAQSPYGIDFSSDGRWLATAGCGDGATLWPSDGGRPITLEGCGRAGDRIRGGEGVFDMVTVTFHESASVAPPLAGPPPLDSGARCSMWYCQRSRSLMLSTGFRASRPVAPIDCSR